MATNNYKRNYQPKQFGSSLNVKNIIARTFISFYARKAVYRFR